MHGLRQIAGHHNSGRFAEAENIYRQILAHDPAHADALHHLGMIAHRFGRLDVAADLMRRSIARCPDVARYHVNFGALLSDQRKFDEAIASYSTALQLEPTFAAAHFNMGNALNQQGKFQEAGRRLCPRTVQVQARLHRSPCPSRRHLLSFRNVERCGKCLPASPANQSQLRGCIHGFDVCSDESRKRRRGACRLPKGDRAAAPPVRMTTTTLASSLTPSAGKA